MQGWLASLGNVLATSHCTHNLISRLEQLKLIDQPALSLQPTESHAVSERVLQKYHFRLRKELDVPILLPYLIKYHMITSDVHEELTLQTTNAAKVNKLVAELPRSGEHFLERFIKCLRESEKDEPGTPHKQIADTLEEEQRCQSSPGIVSQVLRAVHGNLTTTRRM